MSDLKFDVVVIGGGHAGAEAARVVARGGFRVVMITLIRDAIGRMSCNPAIGGLAKGNLVKEIDALGGLMPEATDRSGIQFKILNRSKGPAVQGPRAQCDRDLYAAAVQSILEAEPGITILEGAVASLLHDQSGIRGVSLADGTRIEARSVIVTTGTFLRALMHSGENQQEGGRFGEPAAETLTQSLIEVGLRLGRLKTGTPPRILRGSVDFSKMEPQPGDESIRPFSILTDTIDLPQVLCYVTYTGEVAHELIRANLHRAPMYSGQIDAVGPRYCPSIEDKVVRFADKARHHVFVEPEGLTTDWLYLNGISTSLPADIQEGVVRSIPGLEQAVFARYGYAVEYDFVNPEQLDAALQVKDVPGLFLAGQINGTSGYEEAAAQGLIAGINAVQLLRGAESVRLRRDEAYLAVMIDDLITQGTEEPYRMFTSRAEHRLLLGCDSVYERLSPLAMRLGLLDKERERRIAARAGRVVSARESLAGSEVTPDRETLEWFSARGWPFAERISIARFMQRPEFDLSRFVEEARSEGRFAELTGTIDVLREDELEGVIAGTRYAGYLARQGREAERLMEEEQIPIPPGFSFDRPGISREIREKLSKVRPASLAQAGRVRGMTPAALALLRLYLKAENRRDRAISGQTQTVSR